MSCCVSQFRRSHRFAALALVCALLLTCTRLVSAAESATAKSDPTSDADRLALLLQQSRALDSNNPERALALAREASDLARSTQNLRHELQATIRLADALRRNSQYNDARKVVEAGLALPISNAERAERAMLIYISGQIA